MGHQKRSLGCGVLIATLLATGAVAPAADTNLVLSISNDGVNLEGRQRFSLEWNTASNGVYQLHHRPSLDSNSPWMPFDLFTSTGTWFKVTLDGDPLKEAQQVQGHNFYHVQRPGRRIASVEPTILGEGGGTVYLFGEDFTTNLMVRVGGLVVPPNVLQPGSTYSFDIASGALTQGVYDIELLDGTNVVATAEHVLTITAQTQPIVLSLQEPPSTPLAAPMQVTELRPRLKIGSVASARSSLPKIVNVGVNEVLPYATLRTKHDTAKNSIGNIRARIRPDGDCDDDDSSGGGGGGGGGSGGDCDDEFTLNNWPGEVDLMPFSAEIQNCVVDMFVPGRGIDFVFARKLRSRSGNTMPFDDEKTWDNSYNVRVEFTGGRALRVYSGNGRSDVFYQNTNGTWSADGHFTELVFTNNHYELLFPNGGAWEFRSFDFSPATGKLVRCRDRFGNAMQFNYDAASGRLEHIIDTLGRMFRFTYNSNGRLETIQDFAGRVVRYEYFAAGNSDGSEGDLASVTCPPTDEFPAGQTMRYTYSTGFSDERLNHNLLTITDPKKQTWLHVTYHATTDPKNFDFDCVSQIQRGIDKKDIRRGMVIAKPGSVTPHLAVRATVRDAIGNVVEGDYDSRNRLIRLREWTGRADRLLPTTLTDNRPTNPLRTNDPAFYETTVEWNRDSLPTLITFPQGDSFRFVHRQEFGQVLPSKRGELMTLHELPCCGGADTDDDGVLDLTERVWRFDYNPNFGSPALNMRERINELEDRLKNIGLLRNKPSGCSAREKRSDGWTISMWFRTRNQTPGLQNEFTTSFTDPRGNVTTAEYNAQGARVKVKFPWLPADTQEDWAYNSFGQVIAITNAADANGCRSVDEFEYYDTPGQPGHGMLKSATKDKGGLLCGTTPHFLIATTLEYDSYGYVSRIIDPRTNDWLITKSATGLTTARQTPKTDFGDRMKSQYTHDQNDNVIRVEQDNFDEAGNVPAGQPPVWTTELEYDELQRAINFCRHPNGSIQRLCHGFTYDANDSLTVARSGEAMNGNDPHAMVQFSYDERDFLFSRTFAPGSPDEASDQIDYTPNGRKSTQWEPHKAPGLDAPELERTVFTYDGFDRPRTITDAMGNVRRFSFDANDNLKVLRVFGELTDVPGGAGNVRMAESRWSYDLLGRLIERRVSSLDPLTLDLNGDGVDRTTFTYAPNGLLLTETDDNGNTTRFDYDTAGRLTTITDPKTNSLSYVYDNNGNVASITPRNRADLGGVSVGTPLIATYDAMNRPSSLTEGTGNTNFWFYDSRGNCVRHINPRGFTTFTTYDGIGREIKGAFDKNNDGVINANDPAWRMAWDDNDRLVSETDANTNTTTFTYDSRDRRIQAQAPVGTHHTFVWNARGSLERWTDPNGTTVSNSYDLLERCVRQDVSPATGVALTTLFQLYAYNGMSQCVLGSNDVSRTEIRYDSRGKDKRVISDGWDIVKAFDANGDGRSVTYPGGMVLNFTYDSLRRVRTVSRPSGGIALFDYVGRRLDRISRANGVNTRIQWNGLENPPNAQGDFGYDQVSLVNHQNTNSAAVIDRRMFAYDRNQNKILRQQLVSFSTPPTLTTNIFGYDGMDRMTTFGRNRASQISTKSLELDHNGNRIFTTSNGVVFPYSMDNTLPEPGDFQMDQYTMTPFGTHQYDRNGNLIVTASSAAPLPTEYKYDFMNRLVEVSSPGADGTPTVIASYSYDAFGRRISKTVSGGPAPALPITTRFIYDGNDIIEERDGSGALLVSYTRFPSDNTPIVKGSALGGLLSAVRGGHEQFFHQDDLGNVLAVTDENGVVLERYDYDEYGMPRFHSADGVPLGIDGTPLSSSSIGNRLLFHGMEWDPETKFYYAANDGTPIIEWTFEKGWPCRYEGPRFDAENNYMNPATGRLIRKARAWIMAGAPNNRMIGGNDATFSDESPWTAKHKRPGPTRFSHIVLKRGFVTDHNLQEWNGVNSAAMVPRNVLKDYFQTGGQPTQAQFATLIDSMLNRIDDRDLLGLGSAMPGGNTFNPPPPPSSFRARELTERSRLISQGVLKAQRKIERD